jgi:hypothetical protein
MRGTILTALTWKGVKEYKVPWLPGTLECLETRKEVCCSGKLELQKLSSKAVQIQLLNGV